MMILDTFFCIFMLFAGTQAGPGLLIPLYTYPSDSTWESLKSAASSNPLIEFVAIVNPNSGPGGYLDSTFVTGIAGLTQVGVRCIGYVSTNYGATSVEAVIANMEKYTNWYPQVAGFFLDEMAYTEGKESYYASLTARAVSMGKPFTIGNPGTSTTQAYFDSVNNTVIYETSNLPQLSTLHLSFPNSGCSIIAYDVPAAEVNQSYIDNILQYAHLIYITDDTLNNPYDSLPTYFNQLVDFIRISVSSKNSS
uniref:SR4 protein n=1 Tax=Fopius arisanus TaxID=64838 RepID=A0A0C9R993_9HYME